MTLCHLIRVNISLHTTYCQENWGGMKLDKRIPVNQMVKQFKI